MSKSELTLAGYGASLKISEDAVLKLLGDRAMTVREIATALDCSRSTIDRMFKRFKQKGTIIKVKGNFYCKPEYQKRNRDRLNPWIECGCGCGNRLKKFDASGRERKFFLGHNMLVVGEVEPLAVSEVEPNNLNK